MGKWYPYSTEWEKNVVILLIYGDSAIFPLFYDDQDNTSD